MPHWKDEARCYEETKIQFEERNGKKIFKPWPRDKPPIEIVYDQWLEKVVNQATKEFNPARDQNGTAIKGTGPKYFIRTIVRIRRGDGSEFLYSLGELKGYDGLGDSVNTDCSKPEVWTRTLFDYKTVMNESTRTIERHTIGPSGQETVYSLPFNEKNLKALFDQRESDMALNFVVKDERADKAVSVRPESNINDTLKLFKKPFDYLFNGDYVTPLQRAELRQQAIDAGLIAPSTPSVEVSNPDPPKHTYS